jgi:protein gp37
MSDSAIEWTNKVWNPVIGCAKVSAGCKNCYAETVAAGQPRKLAARGMHSPYLDVITDAGRWNGRAVTMPDRLAEPLRWRAPQRVFVNSMSDLFHEDVPFEFIAAVFGVMAAAPRHTFQVLTKRPARMLKLFKWLDNALAFNRKEDVGCQSAVDICVMEALCLPPHEASMRVAEDLARAHQTWPLPNVWIGVSVEDQETANERIPLLLQAPAAIQFISAEPLLGPIDLCHIVKAGIGRDALRVDDDSSSWGGGPERHLDWVIVGGESGPGHRPAEVEWIESLADQCLAAGVPPFVKQDSGSRSGQRGRLSERLWALKQYPEVSRGR